MSKILIKYATRKRPQYFLKAITNIMSTIHDQNYEILVSIDNDDFTMQSEAIKNCIASNPKIKCFSGPHESKVAAINRDMDKSGDWDILVNMSDDFFFVQQGWDNTIRQRVKDVWGQSLDFYAHFDDGYVHDQLCTMSIIGRDYYNRDGYIYYPGYKSFSCDAESYYVAMMRGRYHYFPEVLAKHQHPANSPAPNDELYRANSLHTDHDVKLYFERLRRFFDEPNGHEILKVRPELQKFNL
jgi:hypothetical protein